MRHAFDAEHNRRVSTTPPASSSARARGRCRPFSSSPPIATASIVFVLLAAEEPRHQGPGRSVRNGISGLHTVTGIIRTVVSGTFLYLIIARSKRRRPGPGIVKCSGTAQQRRRRRRLGLHAGQARLNEPFPPSGPLVPLRVIHPGRCPDRVLFGPRVRHRHRGRAAGAGRAAVFVSGFAVRTPILLAAHPGFRRGKGACSTPPTGVL